MKPYFVKHCSPSCGDNVKLMQVFTDANRGEAICEDSQSFLCTVPYNLPTYTIAITITTSRLLTYPYKFSIHTTITTSSYSNTQITKANNFVHKSRS